MAGRLTAAAVSERERTGQQIGRDGKAAKEFELALPESCGSGTFGCNLHMSVIIHAEEESQALFSGMRK
jgi:hypothetical protein